jgi:hypothetical protein
VGCRYTTDAMAHAAVETLKPNSSSVLFVESITSNNK